mmetsp:Transcript_113043/g.319858  ORF Transcript_113043/g.319858 Transcript_113043/m.319858 type:complete len:245 (-) Transcript_113043:182-916(-)
MLARYCAHRGARSSFTTRRRGTASGAHAVNSAACVVASTCADAFGTLTEHAAGCPQGVNTKSPLVRRRGFCESVVGRRRIDSVAYAAASTHFPYSSVLDAAKILSTYKGLSVQFPKVPVVGVGLFGASAMDGHRLYRKSEDEERHHDVAGRWPHKGAWHGTVVAGRWPHNYDQYELFGDEGKLLYEEENSKDPDNTCFYSFLAIKGQGRATNAYFGRRTLLPVQVAHVSTLLRFECSSRQVFFC